MEMKSRFKNTDFPAFSPFAYQDFTPKLVTLSAEYKCYWNMNRAVTASSVGSGMLRCVRFKMSYYAMNTTDKASKGAP